jgi:tRNA threonylcarbamoyladenosine biosynthesis protein TsaE
MDSITLHSHRETEAFGEELAKGCQGGEVFAIWGPLGAGKTTLIRGIARGLGFPGEVTSPTFTVVHEYTGGRLPLVHIDLYRIRNVEEAWNIGIAEYLPWEGVTAIEWPEVILAVLPPESSHWEIDICGEQCRLLRRKVL